MPAIVRSDLGALLEAGLKADFLNAYRRAQDSLVYTRIASVIQTTLPTQKYAWLGSVPTMREWIDERLPRGLKKYEYAISDKVWEASIAVDRKALEDDQLSAIRLRVRDLGNEAARHKDQLGSAAASGGLQHGGTGWSILLRQRPCGIWHEPE